MNSGKCPLCGNMNLEQVNDGLVYSKCNMCGWVSQKYKITCGSNTNTVMHDSSIVEYLTVAEVRRGKEVLEKNSNNYDAVVGILLGGGKQCILQYSFRRRP